MGKPEDGKIIEQFFLDNFNMERLFTLIGQYDYLFLYNIRRIAEQSEDGERVYLSELAETMGFSVAQTSGEIQRLQDKGYVSWETDHERARTYVRLGSKAVELMAEQKRRLTSVYERITDEIEPEEFAAFVATLRRISGMIRESGASPEES